MIFPKSQLAGERLPVQKGVVIDFEEGGRALEREREECLDHWAAY
jgi:hypothetical protein